MKISVIAALGVDRGIGYQGKLLWRIPEDLARFKRLTLGHPIIMGRRTFESIYSTRGASLPGRDTIVISGNALYHPEASILRARDLSEAITQGFALHSGERGIFICGGARVYQNALAQGVVTKLYLTLIEDKKPADTFFPPYEHLFAKGYFEERRDWGGLKYRFVELEK